MIVVLMGVTGCGKTTVGTLLAEELGWQFLDGDDFHPPSNVAKMRSGHPLEDEDRQEWLDRLSDEAARQHTAGGSLILACSALKRAYRERLRRGNPGMVFVYLRGAPALIRARLEARRGHYMDPALLDSQFEILEEPEDGVVVDVDRIPERIVAAIREAIGR